MGMSCLDCHDFMDGYNRGKREGVIEELEKIKDRLEVAMWYNRRDKEYCLELIGKSISKLKGENNAEKSEM